MPLSQSIIATTSRLLDISFLSPAWTRKEKCAALRLLVALYLVIWMTE